jgi:hypothetical protein
MDRLFGPPAASLSMSRETVGSEATGPNTAGSARSIATSARQSPAQRDRQGHVQQDLPRIMHRPRPPPRRERPRYRPVQPSLADCLDDQHSTGLGDHRPTAALDADTRVGPDTLTHLESASDRGGNRDLENPHSRWSEALSAFLTTRRTGCFTKA